MPAWSARCSLLLVLHFAVAAFAASEHDHQPGEPKEPAVTGTELRLLGSHLSNDDVNPCLGEGVEYSLMKSVTLSGDHFPFGGTCQLLGEKSFFIFVHVPPHVDGMCTNALCEKKGQLKDHEAGYVGVNFRFVTSVKTFQENHIISYEAFKGSSGGCVVKLSLHNDLALESTTTTTMTSTTTITTTLTSTTTKTTTTTITSTLTTMTTTMTSTTKTTTITTVTTSTTTVTSVIFDINVRGQAYALASGTKKCMTVAMKGEVCTGVKELTGGRRLGSHEGSSDLIVSSSVDGLADSAKSISIATINSVCEAIAKDAEVIDGDGGLGDFKEAPEFTEDMVEEKEHHDDHDDHDHEGGSGASADDSVTTTTTAPAAAVADFAARQLLAWPVVMLMVSRM